MTIVNPGQRIEKIVLNLSNLPSLPFIANKIIEVAESKTSAAKDIAEIIAIDQSLTAKLLKLVNSSFYGFSSKIATVSRAVVVLGFQTVKTLALGVTVFKTASKMQGDKVCLDMEKFWEHSVGVAAGAKLLAELTGYVMTEEAFLAGLLHDIGKIIFNQYLPDEFSKALYLAKTNNIPLLLAEREIIKADHEVAGDYLAERWKIPYNLRIAVSRHHNPPFREEHIAPDVLKLTCIVSLSNTLCKMRKIGYSGNDQVTAKEEAVMHWLNIGEKEINRFFMQIDSELEKAKEFLGILNESEKDEAAAALAAEEERPVIIIFFKNKQRILMSFLYMESIGFKCIQKEKIEDFEPLNTIKNLKGILTDELNPSEIEFIKDQINNSTDKNLFLNEIPVPFNSEAIRTILKIEKGIITPVIAAKKKKILIICPIAQDASIIDEQLDPNIFTKEILSDPSLTINKVKEFMPNLIILDINFTEITGFSLVLQLLKNFLDSMPETRNTRIIMISSGLNKELLKKLFDININEIILKPYQPEFLLNKIFSILNL